LGASSLAGGTSAINPARQLISQWIAIARIAKQYFVVLLSLKSCRRARIVRILPKTSAFSKFTT
jgi:hypothetical protein